MNKPTTKKNKKTANSPEKNLKLLRDRRKRIATCIDKLKAITDGTTEEVDMDDIIEAAKLLGMYRKRLLKAVVKNKSKITE